jgi:hypothetical protein
LESIQDCPFKAELCHEDQFVQKVIAQLQQRLGSQVRDLQLENSEGGLILRGTVSTHYAKQVVQEVVMQISDRAIAANDIEVQSVRAANGFRRHG